MPRFFYFLLLVVSAFCCRLHAGSLCESDYDVIQITSGQNQTWFGYYDKWQVDPSGRYAIGCKVDLLFRSPTATDVLEVGLIDLENGFKWTKIGESTSWGWQQGCMAQWIPGPGKEVIWNDHGKKGVISRIYNVTTGKTRELPRPIYTLSPDGSFALSIDFERLQFYRPGYGYPSKQKRNFAVKTPESGGIFKMDLKTGKSELIVALADIAAIDRPLGSVKDYYHWVNHLLVNPSATRFIFLNRSRPVASVGDMNTWYEKNKHREHFSGSTSGRYKTRAMTASMEGGDIYPLNDDGKFSHFIWKGDDIITAWATTDDGGAAAFYEFDDRTKNYRMLDKQAMPTNGHNTYVPNTNNEWILNDTYPLGKDRMQELYLYHVPTKRKVVLGRFHEPKEFSGEWRCDLHPRTDQAGQRVFFDSTHSGRRQMYMIDIGDIVGQATRYISD